MHVILKSPLTMVKRISDWVRNNGKLVTHNSNNACYVWDEEDQMISTQFERDEIYSITVDRSTTFIIEDGEVVCVEGEPNKLLPTYEFCEMKKDSK